MLHSTASLDRDELRRQDYEYAKILSVSENGHRLPQKFDFAKVQRLVFAGIPRHVLFANVRYVIPDPGGMTSYDWCEDLGVWIGRRNHNAIMCHGILEVSLDVSDHREGYLEIEIRLRTGKIITLRCVRKVN
ncbi:MAG: hypothetical protein O3A99_09870 [Proteobacteria bacterium]|nr:hypothetical protein [Pseudomonadota bacterium]